MKRIIAFAVVVAISSSAYLLGWSNLFPVKSLTIAESDKEIVSELRMKLREIPAPIVIGEPIARVDKREITSRLRDLIWVDGVEIRRNFFSGEVSVSVEPRSAIGQLDDRWSANPAEMAFLGTDLSFFFVPRSEVAKAAKSGDSDWLSLPKLALGSDERALLEETVSLLAAISGLNAETISITAPDRESFKSRIKLERRELDISWGSVNELPLKIEVLQRLLELKANRNVKRVDLSAPLAPIVSNNP